MSQAVSVARAPSSHDPGALVPRTLPEAMRMAEVMASARRVPDHLQGDVGSCFMIIEQAVRWQMSPFLVAQCTSNIGGKLCYEGKLIAAALTSTGAIVGEFDYEFSGDPKKPETLKVIATATRASDRQRKTVELAWIDAKTQNKFWNTQPEQQLIYAVSRVWGRRWTPGPMLGVYAPEEIEEIEVQSTVISSEPEKPAIVAPPKAEPEPPKPDAKPDAPKADAKEMSPREWLDEFKRRLDGGASLADITAICDDPAVKAAGERFVGKAKKLYDDLIADALDRHSGLDTTTAGAGAREPMET